MNTISLLAVLLLAASCSSVSGDVASASPKAVKVIKRIYPRAVPDHKFLSAVKAKLAARGFRRGNSIAFIDTCRDESTRKFSDKITKIYSYTFNIAGLGGIITSGSIGFGAGQSHSPIRNGREKYIFFAMPHIAVNEDGVVGSMRRPGRAKQSTACGALIAIQGMAKMGTPKNYADPDNIEFTRLAKRTLVDSDALTRYGSKGPSLVQVTSHTAKVIANDLERMIRLAVNVSKADYAVITGVQIQSGAQVKGEPYYWSRFIDYISPNLLYTVVNGKKKVFTL